MKRERSYGQTRLKSTNHLYDDGELETERATALKAYSGVGCPDPEIYARWGTACLVMHQFW